MIVAIIRIPRPAEAQAAAGLEARFAERLGFVQGAAGFAGFELLRPVEGADHYLSISRWADRAAFDAWAASNANAQAHGRPAPAAGGAPAEAPAGHGHGAGGPPRPQVVELYEVAVP
jgi:heme-degrading monooxygenase HmoA